MFGGHDTFPSHMGIGTHELDCSCMSYTAIIGTVVIFFSTCSCHLNMTHANHTQGNIMLSMCHTLQFSGQMLYVLCRHRPLGRLAELYSRLLHGADLSPSDEFISLILLSAAQRKTRQEHIRKAIDAHRYQKSQEQKQLPQLQQEHHSCRPSQSAAQQHGSDMNLNGPVNDSAYMSDDSSGRHKSGSLQSHSPDQLADGNDTHQHTHQQALNAQQQVLNKTLSSISTPNAADDMDMLGRRCQPSGQNQIQAPGQEGLQPASEMHHVGSVDVPMRVAENSRAREMHDQQRHHDEHEHMHQHQQPRGHSRSELQDDAAVRMIKHLKSMEEGLNCNSPKGKEHQRGHKGSHGLAEQGSRNGLSVNGNTREGLSFRDRKSSRRHLNQDHFFHRDFMLAPSAFASEYDPDMAPDELADIYTGQALSQMLHCSSCICKHATDLNMHTFLLPSDSSHCAQRAYHVLHMCS